MLKAIRNITIMSCLMLPFASFVSAEKPNSKETKIDQQLAAKIKKGLANDDSLKAYAGAVDVIVENGQVTLKGAVRSDEQSQDIQAKAESEVIQVTPLDRINTVVVHNELTVSPD
jgi:osmotically-inducible protein OsmY